MNDDQEKLVTVLEKLENHIQKQVSLKFAFLKGAIYGLGIVVGTTILIAILSTLAIWIFGEGTSINDLLRTR